jgi:alpha-tubulin suppressor-like RCC1 family protein
MIRSATPLIKLSGLTIAGCDTNNARITNLSYSRGHVIAVLSNGDSAGLGDTSSCQLGTGSPSSTGFSLALGCEKCVAAGAGTDFTLLVGESGAIFSCGIENLTVQPFIVPNA